MSTLDPAGAAGLSLRPGRDRATPPDLTAKGSATASAASAIEHAASRAAKDGPADDPLAALVRRCAAQDEAALAELHRQMARRIHAFAFQRLRDSTDAETIVIDTLMEVWRSAARFRAEAKASTWILGIARFKCLQLRDTQPPQHEDIEDHAETLAADSAPVEAGLEAWQQARRVRDCMDSLSEVQRECLHLVYFDGLGLADVARLQQVPENTVKTRLFHARRAMRTCVETPPARPRTPASRRTSA